MEKWQAWISRQLPSVDPSIANLGNDEIMRRVDEMVARLSTTLIAGFVTGVHRILTNVDGVFSGEGRTLGASAGR